jgi:hypothetical protein
LDNKNANIVDQVSNDNEYGAKAIEKDEKIWRISSLTASVDDETRILVIPVPESKRKTKIVDTKYTLKSYEDLAKFSN